MLTFRKLGTGRLYLGTYCGRWLLINLSLFLSFNLHTLKQSDRTKNVFLTSLCLHENWRTAIMQLSTCNLLFCGCNRLNSFNRQWNWHQGHYFSMTSLTQSENPRLRQRRLLVLLLLLLQILFVYTSACMY